MNRFMNPNLLGQPAQPFRQVSPLQALLGGGEEMMQQAMPQQAMQPAMNPRQNRMAGFREMLPDIMIGLGAGLASGNPGATAAIFQQQLADGRERKQRDASKNATLQWMRGQAAKNPMMAELIGLVEAGALTPADAFKMAQQRADPGYRVLTPQEKQQYGLDPRTPYQVDGSGKISQIGGGGVTVNNMGNIPAGFEVFEDPQTGARQMRPIPGGPAAMEQQQVERAKQSAGEQANTASDVITTAAARAREAAKNRAFGGIGQGIVQMNPYTDSAEVARQVDVLKSNASIENLNAMRRASPTGGALGSVTERENQMLAQKSGALDPSSPTFLRDLDDYERTLLRIIHGAAEGDRIFAESRRGSAGGDQSGGGGMGDDIDSLVDKYRSR